MKEELMTEVMQHMLSYLDNAQMKQLRQVMEHALCRYNVTELEMKPEEDDSNNLIARFIAAKRIEGCSEKTKILRSIPYFMKMNNYLLQSINYIFQLKKN